jgi:hypothetical protein
LSTVITPHIWLTLSQVALKKTQDDFSVNVFNEYLLYKLPELFTPEIVGKLDNDVVASVAGESEESREERQSLTKKLTALRAAQKIAHRMHRHKPKGMACLDKSSYC